MIVLQGNNHYQNMSNFILCDTSKINICVADWIFLLLARPDIFKTFDDKQKYEHSE
jgi:hypothetical protein